MKGVFQLSLPRIAPLDHGIKTLAVFGHLLPPVLASDAALLAWRYVPFLMRPRVDGKEH